MSTPGSAVTIGAYDGVHLGHLAVLRELRRLATEAGGLATVVVTFDRHPASIVRPESAPKLLTDLDQKLEVLEATGLVDRTLVVAFDAARAHEEAEDFVREVLVDRLDARLVVVGKDFHFGHGRRGNVELLRRLGADLGFDVAGLDLVGSPDSEVISSTAIRRAVAAGDVSTAARLLGRPFEIRGLVVTGDKRGRDLGYPTANIQVSLDRLLPGVGIYAGWYERPDRSGVRARSRTVHAAAVSVGVRPTFTAKNGDGGARAAAPPIVEAYLLDFEGDLYDEPARLRFMARLRDEQRFASVEALVAQMDDDVVRTRAVLAAMPSP